MNEKQNVEFHSPFHILRCAVQLGKLAIAEAITRRWVNIGTAFDDMQDVWGDDND